MQYKFYATVLSILLLAACKSPTILSKIETTEYILSDTSIAEDSLITEKIRPYSEKMSADMGIVLAQSSQAMSKGLPESLLGNFVADLCFERVRREYKPQDGHSVDFAFFNNGGLRKSLPAGNITKGDIYELMPFENELVILTLDAEVLKKLLNFIASKGGEPVSALRFVIKDKTAVDINIGGIALDPNKIYKVVTSDYLANGGDNYSFLSSAINRESTSIKIRDAIIQDLYIAGKTEEIVNVKLDGRIRNE
ncbi:MAG TPA: 5'-nucleotidase [Bacteroidia bacterium]|nr:5'-nucleotidase [Bacteroidia bacterium]HNS11565.1 5'-nucleotidase [Bacteroidia bacterium]